MHTYNVLVPILILKTDEKSSLTGGF